MAYEKTRVVLSTILLFISCAAYCGTGSGTKSIDRVEVTDIFFTVYFSDGAAANDGCQQADRVVYWRADYPSGYGSMLVTALTAHSSGKKVTMWFDGCKTGPWGLTLPKAQSIVIRIFRGLFFRSRVLMESRRLCACFQSQCPSFKSKELRDAESKCCPCTDI